VQNNRWMKLCFVSLAAIVLAGCLDTRGHRGHAPPSAPIAAIAAAPAATANTERALSA